jgi:hypothetical protein
MLNAEERQRIEAEEQKRVAEEQYRAQVRSNLTPAPRPAKPANPLRVILVILAVAAVLCAILAVNFFNRAKPDGTSGRVEKTRLVPTNQKIAMGQIQVNARAFAPYKIQITPDMRQPTLTGTFTASGWAGNDIDVAVISGEENFTNWTNGHKAQVLWHTDGQETTGKFSVTLAPGVNYLVVSNQASLVMNRQVSLDVDLNFQKVETYYE